MSVSYGGINSKPIRERTNQGRFWSIKATVIMINTLYITKGLIIVTVSLGWEALTTSLDKHASEKNRDRIGSLRNNNNIIVHDANNEVYSFFALKGKCRSKVDYQSVGKN